MPRTKSTVTTIRGYRRASREPDPCLQVCMIALFFSLFILVLMWVRLSNA